MDPDTEPGPTVVVPAISHPSSLACSRSLAKRGFRTVFASENDGVEAFCSRYCDESVSVPAPESSETGYKDALLSLARRPAVKTILPVRETDIYVLAKYRDEFAPHVGTPWPDFDTLARVQDRLRLYEVAESAGVPTPETALLTECGDWSGKWILKGRYSLLTDAYLPDRVTDRLVRPPSTRYVCPGEKPSVTAILDEMGHEPIVQEYLPPSDEYGFFALYDRGEAIATFQHRQIRGIHFSGGASAYRESVSIPELERLGRNLLDALDWHGVAMVEFKKDAEGGEFKLMEINPRFWSSLPFTVQTGADFPYYYWLLANGDRDAIDCRYDVGIGGHLLSGEVSHLLSILRDRPDLVDRPSFTGTLCDVLTSIVRQPRFDYLDASDPCPFVRHARRKFEGLVTRWANGEVRTGRRTVTPRSEDADHTGVSGPGFEYDRR